MAMIDTTLGQLRILYEIVEERKRQDEKWGEQNYPFFERGFVLRDDIDDKDELCAAYSLPTEDFAKHMCKVMAARGALSWPLVLVEELSEAVCAPDVQAARSELVQLAAVTVAAIESIDRNHPRDGAA